jgi:hypothetical protein
VPASIRKFLQIISTLTGVPMHDAHPITSLSHRGINTFIGAPMHDARALISLFRPDTNCTDPLNLWTDRFSFVTSLLVKDSVVSEVPFPKGYR